MTTWKRRLGAVGTATLLTLGGTIGVAGSANARPTRGDVHCGDTITTDTVLQRDLVNCPDVGLVIGADNVTLNLNGHEVDGDGI